VQKSPVLQEGTSRKAVLGGKHGRRQSSTVSVGSLFSHLMSVGGGGGDVTWRAEEGVVFCRSQLWSDMKTAQNFSTLKTSSVTEGLLN